MTLLVLTAIVVLARAETRNLQFSHFNPDYLPNVPKAFQPFIEELGNRFDPYVNVKPFSVSGGAGSSNVAKAQVQCRDPLRLIGGACQCPNGGKFFATLNTCTKGNGNDDNPDNYNNVVTNIISTDIVK